MKTITPEEARTLMGDFARGGEPVIAAWLHGFDFFGFSAPRLRS